MITVLGCIADDFTDATDLAGLFARRGVRVSLRIGVPSERASDTAEFEVIAPKSRAAPVQDAVAEPRTAWEQLQALFKIGFHGKIALPSTAVQTGTSAPSPRH